MKTQRIKTESNDFVQSINQCTSEVLSTRPPPLDMSEYRFLLVSLLTQGEGAQLCSRSGAMQWTLRTCGQELPWAKPMNLLPHHTWQIQKDISPLSGFVLFIPLAYSSRLIASGLSSIAYTDIKKNSREATQLFMVV